MLSENFDAVLIVVCRIYQRSQLIF